MPPAPASSKLPKWIFYVSDAVLVLAAWFIANRAPQPLTGESVFAITACVIVGAIIGTIPIVVAYEREKNDVLDERQRALEALAQTVANSAEQISAAAGGLHQIAELTQKNLRHAEQLPHKLQDKIAEFQAQLANADDAEKEELETELTTLRASESERLESISNKIAKSTADWTKLEAAMQKNLSAAQDALAKAAATLEEKTRTAIVTLETKLAGLETATKTLPLATVAPVVPPDSPPPFIATTNAPGVVAATVSPEMSAKPAGGFHPPKAPRKARRDDFPVETFPPSEPAPTDEPPPAKLQEVVPIAPSTQAPFAAHLSTKPVTDLPTPESGAETSSSATAELKSAKKRREKKADEGATTTPPVSVEAPQNSEKEKAGPSGVPKPNAPEKSPAPAPTSSATPPAFSEFAQVSPEEVAPPAAVAADGATRLIVTAYIGIGNRLFIRGEGPGLSWEKGVPLQFVSIGKWRWETADASAPVKFKLYKNDAIECAALGTQTLAPGHQQEVTAGF